MLGEVSPDIKYTQDRNAPKEQRTDVDYDGLVITGVPEAG